MAERFYTPDCLGPGGYELTGAEAHHLSTVRRFAIGDRVVLFNGDGNEYAAEIRAVDKKSVALDVLSVSPVDRELAFPLVIASALPKGDRADFLIEKLTELGVKRFIPLITARSVVVPKESAVEKFTRAVVEASKQCGRNRLMAIDAPRRWDDFLRTENGPGARILLHPAPGAERLTSVKGKGAVIAAGPEGGFAVDEVENAVGMGWFTASLGSRILRIETAAVAAAALLALGERARSQ
jgi:16S rRNA (uracil1498-N3)-methyltransferase